MGFDKQDDEGARLTRISAELSTSPDMVANLLKEERREARILQDLPSHLRGPTQNRFGGHQMCRMRGFKGADYKHYGSGRVLDGEEKQRVIEELKARGEID